MVTGAGDNQLRVWSLETTQDGKYEKDAGRGAQDGGEQQRQQQARGQDDVEHVIAVYMGSVTRQGNGEHNTTTGEVNCTLRV